MGVNQLMQQDLQLEFNRIVDEGEITTVFQVIWDQNNNRILGYEALTRGPKHSYFRHPVILFEYARQFDRLQELELDCAILAKQQFSRMRLKGALFINFSPDTLLAIYHRQGTSAFEALRSDDLKLVIELTEHHPINVDQTLLACITELRNLGIKFALDDFGAGYAGLKTWLQIAPEYLKLDQFFCNELLHDNNIPLAISSILEIAKQIGSEVIAENIENAEQYQQLSNLGLGYMQGFHISRPSGRPKEQQTAPERPNHNELLTAFSLAKTVTVVSPDMSAKELLNTMLEDKQMTSLPVVDQQLRVLGLIKKEELLSRYSSPYGHSLNYRKSVADLMDAKPLIIESDTSLSEIGRRLTQHTANGLDAAFIITQQDKYLGLGLAVDVMRKLSEYKLQLARYANPLTLLPGNVPLQRSLKNLIQFGKPFDLAYFDLNNFKPFNDCCGYERGDQMIKLVAELLRTHLSSKAHFIGHLGGDDFIVIFIENNWQTAVRQLLATFEQRSKTLYRQKDLDAQGIISKNREGHECFFPLIGLAVGVTSWLAEYKLSIEALSEAASRAKKAAKQNNRSSLYIDQAVSLTSNYG